MSRLRTWFHGLPLVRGWRRACEVYAWAEGYNDEIAGIERPAYAGDPVLRAAYERGRRDAVIELGGSDL